MAGGGTKQGTGYLGTAEEAAEAHAKECLHRHGTAPIVGDVVHAAARGTSPQEVYFDLSPWQSTQNPNEYKGVTKVGGQYKAQICTGETEPARTWMVAPWPCGLCGCGQTLMGCVAGGTTQSIGTFDLAEAQFHLKRLSAEAYAKEFIQLHGISSRPAPAPDNSTVSQQVQLAASQQVQFGASQQVQPGVLPQVQFGESQQVQHRVLPQVQFGESQQVQHRVLPQVQFGVSQQVQHGVLPQVQFGESQQVQHGVLPQVQFGVSQQVQHGVLPQVQFGESQQVQHGVLPQVQFGASQQVQHGVLPQVQFGVSQQVQFGVSQQVQHGVPQQVQFGVSQQAQHGASQQVQSGVSQQVQFGVSQQKRANTQCKCGSTTHLRISHADCPLNHAYAKSQPAQHVMAPQTVPLRFKEGDEVFCRGPSGWAAATILNNDNPQAKYKLRIQADGMDLYCLEDTENSVGRRILPEQNQAVQQVQTLC